MLPKPWQVGQAPNGLLNENSRGCGTSYGMPHVAALEAFAEAVRLHRRAGVVDFDRERRAVAFVERGLDRVGQTRAHVGGDLDAIDDHRDRGRVREQIARRATASSIAIVRPATSNRPKPRRRSASSVAVTGSSAGRRAGLRSARAAIRRRRLPLASSSGLAAVDATSCVTHERMIETDQQARALGEREQLRRRRRRATRARLRLPHCRQIVRPTRAHSRRR